MDKFKENASNALGNERVGEIEGERDNQPTKTKQKKAPKPAKIKKEKKRKEPKMKKEKKETSGFMKGLFDNKKKEKTKLDEKIQETEDLFEENSEESMLNEMKAEAEFEDDPSKYIQTDQVGGRNRAMILKQLNIEDTVSIPSDLVTPEQIENVEFTVSLPSGLDADEVSRFCDIMENAVRKYRSELIRISKEKEKLIDEILRGEQQVLEQRNQSQLNSFLEQGSSEKERLQESLIEAQRTKQKLELENEKLKNKLSELPNIEGELSPEIANENEELKHLVRDLQAKLAQAEATAVENQFTSNTNKSEMNSETAEMLHQAEKRNKELERELDKLREKSRMTTQDDSVKLENQQLKDEIEKLKKSSTVIPNAPIDSPEDYEKRIMEQFTQGKINKHVKTKLTDEDIAKMKEAQESGDITIKGFENVVSSGDSSFDDMMKELNT